MEENNQQTVVPTETPKSETGLFITLGIVALLAIIGLFILKSKTNITTISQTAAPVADLKNISITEVAKHSTKEDCWLLIDGNVYDVSAFIPKHPGEDQILLGCGKDATELFATKAGKGIPHSSKAVGMREEFKIGILSGT